MRELRQTPSEPTGRPHPRQIDQRNYANSQKVRDFVNGNVLNRVSEIVGWRREYNQDVARYWDVHEGRPNEESRIFDGGISDLYIPVGAEVIETLVEQVGENLFPNSGIVNVSSTDPLMHMLREPIYDLLMHFVEQSQAELQVAPMLRQGLVAGISPVKVDWKTIEIPNYQLAPQLNDAQRELNNGEQIFAAEDAPMFTFDGPTFDVVNFFRWYAWPFTVQHLWEAQMVFEFVDHSMDYLKDMQAQGHFYKVDRVEQAGRNQTSVTEERNRTLESVGFTEQAEEKRKNGIYELVELYTLMQLPGTKGRRVPVQIVAYGDVVLQVRQNPFWHQQPPYLFWRPRAKIDNIHGRPHVKALEHLQYAANVSLNLGLDNLYWQNSPALAIWADRLGVDVGAIEITPGMILETMGDPSSIAAWHRPPPTIQDSFFISSSLTGLIRDMGGAPPILQGKMGNNDITATQANILQGGASSGVRALTRSAELMVMTPYARMMFNLAQQFMSPRKQKEIAASPLPPVPVPLLASDTKLRWATTTQAVQAAQEIQVNTQLGLPGGVDPQQQALAAQQAGTPVDQAVQGLAAQSTGGSSQLGGGGGLGL